MSTALEIITAVNALVTLATNMGLSFQKLAQYQQKAALEGREFGKQDLEAMANEARADLDKLKAMLGE